MSDKIKIKCSRERIKRIICASRGIDPEADATSKEADPDRSPPKEWEFITEEQVQSYIRFASLFLYKTAFRLELVDQEP